MQTETQEARVFRYKTICNEQTHTNLFRQFTKSMRMRSEAVFSGIPEASLCCIATCTVRSSARAVSTVRGDCPALQSVRRTQL